MTLNRKNRAAQLTPQELEIMKVLWAKGEATVQDVQTALSGERKLAYTTVMTMLNVLYNKKRVKRKMQGKAYIYRPTISEESAAIGAVNNLREKMFGGSAERLVMTLLSSKTLTRDQLTRIQKIIEENQHE